jgi:hypothetical protein
MKYNRIKWRAIEHNRINISFYYLNILEKKRTKLTVSDSMR